MPNVRIKVGVSIDSDMSNVMRPIRDEAKKVRQQIASDQKTAEKEAARASLAIWRDQYRENSRLNREMLKTRAQAERDAAKQGADAINESARRRLSVQLENIRKVAAAERNAANISSREKLDRERRTMKEQQRLANESGMMNYFGGRAMMSSAGRTFGGIARGALRVGGSIASGMGIDFDLSSSVRRNVERQRMAVDLSNSAFQPGAKGAAGQRQDPEQLAKEARELGNLAKVDPTKVLSGFQKFTEVSGDLATARESMKDLVFLSQATGSQIDHVAEAAGNVNAQLGEIPNKGQVMLAVMRAVAGQGKLGAIELKDQAKQMAALAAQAGRFGGDKANTIITMGILAQAARQHGTAKSASEASFAVSSFSSTFAKDARLKQMLARGINPMGANNMIKDPFDLIKQMLVATHGDPRQMNKMVMDARANKVILPFQTIFNETKGGTKEKIAAVDKEINRLRITMGTDEIADSARARMNTDEANAQAFQNQIDEVTRGLQTKLAPALQALAPHILSVAQGFGKLVEWAAGSPWEAASAALAISVTKAGMGEVIARALTGSLGSGGGVAGAAGAGMRLGGLGGLESLVGATVVTAGAIVALGLAAEQAQKLWNETHRKTVVAPGTSPEDEAKLLAMTPEERQAATASSMNKKSLQGAGFATQPGLALPEVLAALDAKNLANMTQQSRDALRGVLKVHIVNAADIVAGAPPRLTPNPVAEVFESVPKNKSLPTDGVSSPASGFD